MTAVGSNYFEPVFGDYRPLSKTITFTGAANLGAIGTFPIATVSGGVVLISMFTARVTTTCVGATATIALGATGTASAFLNATAIANFAAGNFFAAQGAATAGAVAVAAGNVFYLANANLIGTVATAAVTAGVIEFDMLWAPLTPGATLS